ncbi:cleavage and polyadenylation specificity factor subunit 7-like [Pteropus medius]|uniref:cleavage and polyadenylation specificity factor subunit 7-like n=1 Tax=Pteropus vampyrus TaxID=132908 RepID=UPI00196B49DD|nr:cleavage and polyadenylation specificity factor subunit 7-like [Pteropus giganteus]
MDSGARLVSNLAFTMFCFASIRRVLLCLLWYTNGCTSPWASTPALHLSPAIIFSPNATVEPPPDIHMKALNSLNHHGSQDLGIPTSMVREAEFEEIIK